MAIVAFSIFAAPICRKDATPEKEVTLEEVYEYIRSDTAKGRTVDLRTLPDKKDRDALKRKTFDFVTFSGTFSNRREDGLIRHSGLICLDLDHIGTAAQVESMKAKVAADDDIPVVLTFTSPSGDGMKVIVKVDIQPPTDHKIAFQALADIFKQKYGLIVDPSGKDVCRACFLPYDPNAILRTGNRPALSFNRAASAEPMGVKTLTLVDKVESIIQLLEERHVDITDQYDDWLRTGLSLAHEFGEGGRIFFHRISAMSSKYSITECDKKFDNLLRTSTGEVGIGSLFHLAQMAGVSVPASVEAPPSHESGKKTMSAQTAQAAHLGNSFTTDPELELLPTIYDKVRDDLPEILKKCSDCGSSMQTASERDVRVLASLAVISSALPNCSGVYSGHRVYPNMYVILDGPPSSGKGNAAPAKHLADPIHEAYEKVYTLDLAQYKAEMRAWHQSEEAGPEPEKPIQRTFFVPGNISKPAFILQLQANQGHAMLFETELDTILEAIKAKHGGFSDILRNGGHHETISMQRRTDDLLIEVKTPRIGVCVAGTPDQVNSFIGSTENGLFSRFLFYCLHVDLRWNDPWDSVDQMDIDEYYLNLGNEFYRHYYCRLEHQHRIDFFLSPVQRREFNQIFKKTKAEYYENDGTSIVPSIHRMALSCFRIAMALSVLKAIENGEIKGLEGPEGNPVPESISTRTNRLECDDGSFRAALVMTQHLLEHTRFVYEHLPMSSNQEISPKLQSLLDGLPDRFNRADYQGIAESLGIKARTSDRYIGQLVKTGHLLRWGKNEYRRNY